MKRSIAILLAVCGIASASPSFAQDRAAGPGAVVVTIIPTGGTFFTESKPDTGPGFRSYDVGGAVALNLNRYVGIEGEVTGLLGVPQSLTLGGITTERTTPHFLNYSGNLVVSAANPRSIVPYVTAGVGGLSLFEQAGLGINDTETFLTGNVGGGLTWYAGRWGLRGDYRFIAVLSTDDAPVFFGSETRSGHRWYAGLILKVGQ
jgi:hypothetical protein